MVEPEQTSIAEQRLGYHVFATTNSNDNDRVVATWQFAKHKIPVTRNRITKELTLGFRENAFMKSSNGTHGGGDFCSVLSPL
jgi:hypothetical protein